ncbi:TPA: M48 family metalloprotease [Pseudomonas aeruginosa]|uniref:Peptidase M48 domain-containing protein n=10 Tax=Pseudomonas aeruginosa TaxID=287 RepID=A0A0H2Z9X5_PSEAB|nr:MULTISPECIES: M48 family metallopeptidase [Pseudomonas]ABJ11469.1 hypothetical protein PA14_35020 [Pseudomonas aeruginosa UCBPP-PA14]ALY70398.1 hypothetical protein HW04_05125 [Pseudomonas aeruginosa]ALY75218.1 hypothetical protein HW03_00335 [Pseudomonas aeruginosa]ASM85663.1 hypothetical protein BWR11_15030 [Pseudomonas aeruginosa]AVN47767.1 hypothetical protein AM474_31045 [Pseudomonas aeruginosa]
MKGTVHPRRLLLCLVLVPALLAGLGAWQSWRAEQQAERLGAAQQRVERALAEARALPPRASVRVDGRAYVRDLALARLDEQLADTRSAQRLNRFAAVLADSGACLAALVAVLGAVSLAGIAGAARSALRSRRCLLLWFELGRRLLPCLLLAQIGLLALALACAGTFEILGLWRVGQVPVSEGRTQLSVALILLGLLASAWQMLAKISRLRLRPAPALDVIGRRLGEEDAPELWTLLRELAARLDTPAPQHLLVGLCDGFYVTANRVCLQPSGEHLEGRSLYLSLPLLGLLDRAELSAVIAHELAHFAGRDAHYSLRFLPIYQGAASQLAAIEEQEANVFERAALEPARLLAGYFLERFGLAVNHWSRLREFAADRRAAQLAGAPAMASALLRSAAAGAPIRAFLEHCLLAPARAPDNLVDAIHVYLGQSGLEAPDPGAEGLQVHPQDTHPPLGLRCTALGESFERTWAGTAGRAVPTRPPSQALSVWFGAPLALSRALSADLLGKTCENPHARN